LDESEITQDVRTLILERIDSVVQLEILLLLHGAPDRARSAQEIAQELRIDASWAAGQLGDLAGRGLAAPASEGGELFRYAPASPELDHAVSALSREYNERRVRVISLIFSKPVDKLRSFADAFRFRKDKPNG
jgi:hypothetical protein